MYIFKCKNNHMTMNYRYGTISYCYLYGSKGGRKCPVCSDDSRPDYWQYNLPPEVKENYVVSSIFSVKTYCGEFRISNSTEQPTNLLNELTILGFKKSPSEYWSDVDGNYVLFMPKCNRSTTDVFVITQTSVKNEWLVKVVKDADKVDRKNTPPKPKKIIPNVSKDFMGNELIVGNWLAFTRGEYNQLYLGKIVKFTAEMITVTYDGKEVKTASGSVVKMPPEYIFMHEMSR